jgi:hypothetical protein
MAEKQGLLSRGWGMVGRNKRYIVWFYLLNLALAFFGTAAFSNQAHSILDHSLLADRLVHGFDFAVFGELLSRPEFGDAQAVRAPAGSFALLFLLATALFLPGVLQGYASTYRLPREDFFRACGRNLWRFIRLMIVAGIVMGIAAAALFGIRGALLKVADESTNEMLPVYLSFRPGAGGRSAERSAGSAKVDWLGFSAHLARHGKPAGQLRDGHDCGGDCPGCRYLGVDEVCSPRQRGRCFRRQPVDAAPPVDSALLAARRGGELLLAEHGATDCGSGDLHFRRRGRAGGY